MRVACAARGGLGRRQWLGSVARLSTRAIRSKAWGVAETMQPRLNALGRYAQARTSISEAQLYTVVFDAVFCQAAETYVQSRRFGAADVCAACDDAVTGHLDEPVEALRSAPTSSPRPLQAAGPTLRLLPPPATTAHEHAASTVVRSADRGPSGRTEGARAEAARDGGAGAGRAVSELVEKVLVFAAQAGIDEYVRSHAAAPRGYYMDTLRSDHAEVPMKRLVLCDPSDGDARWPQPAAVSPDGGHRRFAALLLLFFLGRPTPQDDRVSP